MFDNEIEVGLVSVILDIHYSVVLLLPPYTQEKLRHSCACQVPKKHRYFATFHSANYCIFPASIAMKKIVLIKHHMGKKSINVWCPASIALKNDSLIYFDAENGFLWDLASTRMPKLLLPL